MIHLSFAPRLLDPYEKDENLINLIHLDKLTAVDYQTTEDLYRLTLNGQVEWFSAEEAQDEQLEHTHIYREVFITLLYDYQGENTLELLDILFQYDDDDDDFVPPRYTSPQTLRIYRFYEQVLAQFLTMLHD